MQKRDLDSVQKAFYITTTLPYVNAEPHLGHALEFVRADIIARWRKLQGQEVFFNTGTDEHGAKIYRKALEKGQEVQEYVNAHAEIFKKLVVALKLNEEARFSRTTDPRHVSAAQEFWKLCFAAGDIYKKQYTIKYCVGCELEKTDSELEDGKCPVHPSLEVELIEEENYFFRFSRFQQKLLDFYNANPHFVIPDFRFNEVKNFVREGLNDFSISRLKSKMPWGVPVPGDDSQVMYVWFDALINYISTLGWPLDSRSTSSESIARGKPGENLFEKFWVKGETVQYAGKDNLRQQAAMWQAMLMSGRLPNTGQIVINGFVTAGGGLKMSKTLGNTADPMELIEEYGPDALRYFVARELSTFEDSPFTPERFKEAYNANLANGLGNLVSRVMKLAETKLPSPVEVNHQFHKTLESFLGDFEIQKATNHIWSEIGELDGEIQKTKPWESGDVEVIENLVKKLAHIGHSLAPFMPETSAKILYSIGKNKSPEKPLFPRKD
jgi:methionyl-tRNA synthetase